MVLISDNNVHDKTTVVPYSFYVFNYIKENFEGVRVVEVWTDGPTSQFKNKFIFGYIGKTLPDHFNFHLTWNFSATSHGKGAVDGIGGTVKRLATSAVVTRQAIIKDANSLIQAVNHKTKIMLALMSEDYITQTLKNLKMELMWETVRQLPGTMHINCIKPAGKAGNVQASYYKDDKDSFNHPLQESSNEEPSFQTAAKEYSVGQYVIVKYNGNYYPGEILSVASSTARVRTMENSGPKFWKWPSHDDILDYFFADIVKSIDPPTIVSNRGTFTVPELQYV